MRNLFREGDYFIFRPHLIDAVDGNVIDAMVLQCLAHWLDHTDERNLRYGHYWVWNSYSQWADLLHITYSQVRRSLLRLQDLGVVLCCQPDSGYPKNDQTKWYRIDMDHHIVTGELPDHGGVRDERGGARDEPPPVADENCYISPIENTEETSPAPAAPSPRPSPEPQGSQTDPSPESLEPHCPLPEAAAPSPVAEESPKVTSESKPITRRPATTKAPLLTFAEQTLVDAFEREYAANHDKPIKLAKTQMMEFKAMLTRDPEDLRERWLLEDIEPVLIWALNDQRFYRDAIHNVSYFRNNFRKIQAESKKVRGGSPGVSKKAEAQKSEIERMREELSREDD